MSLQLPTPTPTPTPQQQQQQQQQPKQQHSSRSPASNSATTKPKKKKTIMSDQSRASSFADSIDRADNGGSSHHDDDHQRHPTYNNTNHRCHNNNHTLSSSSSAVANLIVSRRLVIPDLVRVDRCYRLPEYGPKILFFSGGSALRQLSQILKRYTHNSIHLITPFDSGGSSAVLRQAFHMLSVGDLRNRLMALADDGSPDDISGNNPHVSALFSHRLVMTSTSTTTTSITPRQELDQIVQGIHPLMKRVKLPMRSILISHLRWFVNRLPANFDLRGASIGNLIIVGCFLEHDRDIITTIFWIGKLLGVNGIVRPITGANLHIRAYYCDRSSTNDDDNRKNDNQKKEGTIDNNQQDDNDDDAPPAIDEKPYTTEIGQHLLGKAAVRRRIEKIDLVESLESSSDHDPTNDGLSSSPSPSISCHIDMVSSELVASADVIVYPMGSFFGSVLVNLLPEGVGKAIVERHCPKIYIPNTGTDPEMYGYTLLECVQQIINLVRKDPSLPSSEYPANGAAVQQQQRVPIEDILTTVLIDTKHCDYCVKIDKEAIEKLGVAVLDIPLVVANDDDDAHYSQQQQRQQQHAKKAAKLDPTKVAEVLLTLGS